MLKSLFLMVGIVCATAHASDLLNKEECKFWAGLAKQVATDRDAGVDVQIEIKRVQDVAVDKSNPYLRDDEDRQGVMNLAREVWSDNDRKPPQAAYDIVMKGCLRSWEKQQQSGV